MLCSTGCWSRHSPSVERRPIVYCCFSQRTLHDVHYTCRVHLLTTVLYLNVSLIFQSTELVVKSRLFEHLLSNVMYHSNQSDYTKHYSTETTLLSVHDYLIRSISHQQISCVCLVDLSAAFDTIDHSILIHRLMFWFGIRDTALTWLTTYLSRFLLLSMVLHHPYPLSYGVLQGSVLTPSFSTCTQHPSALSSHPGH